MPVSTTGINNDSATTLNRYSLIFQFDTFDTTGGQVSFQLDNIEANRNLRDINDPFTFLDDPRDFQTSTIGQDGRLITNASWQFSNDGVIVPLRLGTMRMTRIPAFMNWADIVRTQMVTAIPIPA